MEWRMDLAIDARGLRKEFGQITAVADLTLQVTPGEIFGFLGPNGAGKTTSVKMLLGLIAPTAGTATLLGQPLFSRMVAGRRIPGFTRPSLRHV
jgi:ABC-2 type transport system ATP-binding protein